MIKIEQNEELYTLSISQEVFTNKALVAINMETCKGVNTSMIAAHNLTKIPKEVADEELVRSYQSHIRTHTYGHIYVHDRI